MTDLIRQARLAFITQPEIGTVLLNLQFEGEPGISRGVATFERVQITHEQLCAMAADAVVMALGWKHPNAGKVE